MKFINKYIAAIVLILVLLLFYVKSKANTMEKVLLSTNKKIKLISGAQTMRNDAAGKGNYGAVRNGHIHQGVDILVTPGAPIYAPFDGEIRQANPYANDASYKGLEIKALSGNMKVKVFYCNQFTPGAKVAKGTQMATAQNIAAKYGGGMQPHLHVEVRVNNVVIDPTNYVLG